MTQRHMFLLMQFLIFCCFYTTDYSTIQRYMRNMHLLYNGQDDKTRLKMNILGQSILGI